VAGVGPLQRWLDGPKVVEIWVKSRLTQGCFRPVVLRYQPGRHSRDPVAVDVRAGGDQGWVLTTRPPSRIVSTRASAARNVYGLAASRHCVCPRRHNLGMVWPATSRGKQRLCNLPQMGDSFGRNTGPTQALEHEPARGCRTGLQTGTSPTRRPASPPAEGFTGRHRRMIDLA
jgi:hypothetical protein